MPASCGGGITSCSERASRLIALGGLIAAAAPAQAKELCGSHDAVVAHLDDEYGEKPTAVALASSGGIIQVLVGTDGAWTMVITRPSGVTCIIEFGEGWQAVPPGPEGQPS